MREHQAEWTWHAGRWERFDEEAGVPPLAGGAAAHEAPQLGLAIAAELVHFTRCVREDLEPEPSGREGLTDVQIILAIEQAARTGREVEITTTGRDRTPTKAQQITKPAHDEPELVDVAPPTRH